MKPHRVAVLILVIAGAAGIWLLISSPSESEATAAGAEPAGKLSRPVKGAPAEVAESPRRRGQNRNNDPETARRQLQALRGELEEISRPLHEDIMSSTVNAEINAGESLVTGGYRKKNGEYEVTFITPRLEIGADGKEVIRVRADLVSLGSEQVAAAGLDSLATNARNTLQHAEAWGPEDVSNTMGWLKDTAGTTVLSVPEVLALPSTPFSINLGTEEDRYLVTATVDRGSGGGFSIKSRIERDDRASLQPLPPGDYNE